MFPAKLECTDKKETLVNPFFGVPKLSEIIQIFHNILGEKGVDGAQGLIGSPGFPGPRGLPGQKGNDGLFQN